MNEIATTLNHLLSDVILPNLKTVQTSQLEQIAANDRLEEQINELQTQIRTEFAQLQAQLTACRSEIATLQAILKAVQSEGLLPVTMLNSTVN